MKNWSAPNVMVRVGSFSIPIFFGSYFKNVNKGSNSGFLKCVLMLKVIFSGKFPSRTPPMSVEGLLVPS